MSDRVSAATNGIDPLAIICGGGNFPIVVADAVARQGRRVVLFPLRGWADPVAIQRYPHHWIGLMAAGRFRRLARAEGCRDVVLIGTVLRPPLSQLQPDFMGLRFFPRILGLLKGGDNYLLSGIGELFEEHGFKVRGAHEVAPEILIPEGVLGRHRPVERDLADIACGLSLLAAIGPFDVGQAAVVANNRIIAIEAAEGTDHMLAGIAARRGEGRIRLPDKVGVLVKAPKPSQDRRFDLPSIGARTVEAAAKAGLAGIAIEAKGAITADLEDFVRTANAAGLFVVGVPPGAAQRREQP